MKPEHLFEIARLAKENLRIDKECEILRKYIKQAEKNILPVMHVLYMNSMFHANGMEYGSHKPVCDDVDDMYRHIWLTKQALYTLIAKWDENQGQISHIEHEHNIRGSKIANKIGILDDETTISEA